MYSFLLSFDFLESKDEQLERLSKFLTIGYILSFVSKFALVILPRYRDDSQGHRCNLLV